MSGVPIIGNIADGLGKVLDAPLNAFNDLLGINKKPPAMPEAPKKDKASEDTAIDEARRRETAALGRASTIFGGAMPRTQDRSLAQSLGSASRSLLGK
jgi:hypothetical protein